MRSAIVGCGGIAKVHAESIAALGGHEIVGFADCQKERAEEFAKQYGGNPYGTLEEMLDKEKMDVLHICTPHYLHVPMAKIALECGIHVYQEKPAALSLREYQELKQAVQKSKQHLGISYQNRYNDCVQKAKELIESGNAGSVLGGRAFVTWDRREDYYACGKWRSNLSTAGGGCLINQAVHTLDLLTEFMGKPVGVEAEMKNHHLKDVIEVEDTVEAYITYQTKNGERHGNFYATTSYCKDSTPIIEVVCQQMTLRIEDPELTIIYPDGTIERPDFGNEEEAFGRKYWGNGHKRAIQEFYELIEHGKSCKIELENTDLSNRLMFAIYEASRTGEYVTV